MPNKLRISSPWSQFSIFLVIGFASFFVFFFVENLVVQVTGINPVPSEKALMDIHYIDVSKVIQVLFSVLVFGLTGYYYARVTFWQHPLLELGFRRPSRPSFYPVAILLLIVSFPLEEWLGEFNKRIPLAQWMLDTEKANDRMVEALIKIHHPIDPYINVMVMAVIPAVCEEICFRGGLQRIMIRICRSPLAGIVLSAFLFSFLHLEFEGFLPRMFLGILLGAAYWYSGSLWVPILAHLFFNASQIIVAMTNPAVITGTPSIPFLFVLLSIVIVVGLLYWMRSRSNATYAAVYES